MICIPRLHDSLDSLWSHPTELDQRKENFLFYPLSFIFLLILASFCRSWYSFSFTAGQRVTHGVDFPRKFLLDCCFEGHETHSEERMSRSCQLLPLCPGLFFLSTASSSFSSCRFIHLLMSAPPSLYVCLCLYDS